MMGLYTLVLIFWIYILARISVIKAEVTLSHSPDNVYENTALTLTCQYSGSLDVEGYSWRKNDAIVGTLMYDATSGCIPFNEPDTSLYIYSCPETKRVTLTILQVTQSNNGDSWKCDFFLKDNPSPSSNVYTIIVQVPVTYVTITEPTSTTVSIQENTEQIFECRTSTSQPTALIQWYLDDGTSSPDVRITNNVQQTPAANVNELKAVTGRLTYRPTRQVNGSNLYCSAQTKKSSNKILMYITYPPISTRIDNYIKDSTYSMIAGEQQTLTCRSIDGYPPPTIRWSCFTETNSDGVSGTTVTSERTWTTNTAGQCTCISEHQHGNQRYSLNVVILVAVNDVKFHINSQQVSGYIKVIADSTVPFVCSAAGSSTIIYKWKLGTMEVTGNSLYPSNIQQDGTYTCHASNTLNPTQGQQQSHSSSSSLGITRLYPATPDIRYGDDNGPVITEPLWVLQGQQFQLHCHSASSPASTYTWSRGNYRGSVLTMSSSNDEQVTCTAESTMVPTVGASSTKTKQVSVSIKVLKPPTIPVCVYYHSPTITMDNVDTISVIQGKSFNISCSSTGHPTPSVSWTGSISTNTKTFTSITKDENGIYSITAQNSMNTSYDGIVPGTNMKNISINVLYKPAVHALPDITIIEGNSQTPPVVCQVTPGKPQQTNMKWTWDGNVQLPSRNRETSLELPLNNVNRNQDGTYTCTAENTMDPTKGQTIVGRDLKQFQLTVYYQTSIVTFEELCQPDVTEVTVMENDRTQMKCTVDSNPGSSIYIKHDQEVKHTGVHTNELLYTKQKATCQDTGIYTCSGYNNDIGQSTRPSKALQLYVKCSPRLSPINVTESNQTSTLNTTATLQIYILAYPAPKQAQIEWTKKTGDTFTVVEDDIIETELSTDGIFTRASLQIRNVQQSDFGEYLLYVQHEVSDTNFTLFFNAKDKPSPPTNIGYEKVTTTSAVIYWSPGFDGGSAQTFIIMYKKEGVSLWSQKEVTDSKEDQMDIMLDQLESGSQYSVWIYAFNELGNSTATNLYFTSVAAVPPPGFPAAAIGGAVGALVAVIVAVILILLFLRRRQIFKGKSASDVELNKRNQQDLSNSPEDVNYYNIGRVEQITNQSNNDAMYDNQESTLEYEALSNRCRDATTYSTLQPVHTNSMNENTEEASNINQQDSSISPEDVNYYNIGRVEQITNQSSNDAMYDNQESTLEYEALSNQCRDATTYSTLQPVHTNSMNDNTEEASNTYENLKLRVT